jgi:hypothetical protein
LLIDKVNDFLCFRLTTINAIKQKFHFGIK